MGTDASTLEGASWLKDVFGYNSNFDKEVEELERKVNGKKPKENRGKEPVSRNVTSRAKDTPSNMDPKPLRDYSKTKMSSQKALAQAYADLEKIYPNFNKFTQDTQDSLFFNYLNSSGLYEWA